MAGASHVTIVGNVGRDPEAKGDKVTSFSVAVSQGYGDKKSTAWYRVAVFGKQQQFVQTYIRKGSQVYVSGRLELREWTDKQGTKQTSPEISADDVQAIGSRGQQSEPGQTSQPSGTEDDIPF